MITMIRPTIPSPNMAGLSRASGNRRQRNDRATTAPTEHTEAASRTSTLAYTGSPEPGAEGGSAEPQASRQAARIR